LLQIKEGKSITRNGKCLKNLVVKNMSVKLFFPFKLSANQLNFEMILLVR
jgi:hypothetical protein